MPAGGTGAPFGTIPAATDAEAGVGFRSNTDRIGKLACLSRPLPALATGAAFAVDGLVQQVLALRQAAMTGAAGTTGPLSRIQPLMPALTL